MISWLLIASATAAPGLDGGSSLVAVPTVETVERGEIAGAISLNAAETAEGFWLSGMPMGVSMGASRRAEVGVQVDRNPWSFGSERAEVPAGVGFHARYRFLDPSRSRVGLGLHVALLDLQRDPGVESYALVEKAVGPIAVHFSTGPRYSRTHSAEWTTGLGLGARLSHRVELVADGDLSVGSAGLRGYGVRAGGRVYLDGNFAVLPWLGGGIEDARSWIGGGAALAVFSHGPLQTDRDGDQVVDFVDRCPYAPEDLDEFDDDDGCPDHDNDGDGIPDELDPTPNGGEGPPAGPQPFPTATPLLRLQIHTPTPTGPSRASDREPPQDPTGPEEAR